MDKGSWHYTGGSDQDHPQEKEMQKGKMVVWRGLTNSISWSLLKLMSMESVMPSNHLILCCPLLLLPSIFPNIRVFSNELAIHIKWPKYWSFTFSINPLFPLGLTGLITFQSKGLSRVFCNTSLKASILWHLAFFMVQVSYICIDYWKNHNFDFTKLGLQSDVSAV